jgi:hypothetical protein
MSAFVGTVRSRWSSTDEARRFDVINPATGGVLAQVYGAGTGEVDQAVKVAAGAQHSWARRAPAHRHGHPDDLVLWHIEHFTGAPAGEIVYAGRGDSQAQRPPGYEHVLRSSVNGGVLVAVLSRVTRNQR